VGGREGGVEGHGPAPGWLEVQLSLLLTSPVQPNGRREEGREGGERRVQRVLARACQLSRYRRREGGRAGGRGMSHLMYSKRKPRFWRGTEKQRGNALTQPLLKRHEAGMTRSTSVPGQATRSEGKTKKL